MTKKKWIALGVVLLILVAVGLALWLWVLPMLSDPDVPKAQNTPRQAVDTVMEALMGEGTQERVLLGADGTPVAISAGSGIGKAITSKLHYEVTKMDISEKNAKATLEIIAPDAMTAVQTALQGMESYDEALFLEHMDSALEATTKTNTYTVDVELVLVDSRWCFVTNSDFSNAITGGLISRYAEIQKTIIDAFAGGEEE